MSADGKLSPEEWAEESTCCCAPDCVTGLAKDFGRAMAQARREALKEVLPLFDRPLARYEIVDIIRALVGEPTASAYPPAPIAAIVEATKEAWCSCAESPRNCPVHAE